MQHGETYEAILAVSESIGWRVEEIIGGDKRLDFTRPFLPETLARVRELSFLTPYEARTLNQIRANTYLAIFGLAEEFILPFVLDHARPQVPGEDARVRALLRFADEEAKHIHLFRCFRQDFERGFGARCTVIGPPEEIARAVLAHDQLGVALAVLHIEWMTQRHFVDSVEEDHGLDPQFKSLLKHHWMEECQHAKLDALMIEALAEERDERGIRTAVDDYLAICNLLDGALMHQVEYDMQTFMRATRRVLTEAQKQEFRDVQRQANRWTYLGSGMTHPSFVATLERLGPAARDRVARLAQVFTPSPSAWSERVPQSQSVSRPTSPELVLHPQSQSTRRLR